MIFTLPLPNLFADGPRTREVLDSLRSPANDHLPKEFWYGLLVVIMISVFAWALWVIIKRRWTEWKSSSGIALFNDLCRAHGISLPERRLLWNLAVSQKLSEPASLFLMPECFEIGRMTVESRSHAEEYRQLRDRIFADLGKEPKSSKSLSGEKPQAQESPSAALPLPPLPPTLDLPQWNADSAASVGDQ
jgi:hypothetical protein